MTIPWQKVSGAVEQLFGLRLHDERLPDLKRALKGAAAELGHSDVAACARLLLSGEPDATSTDVLAHHLTIGETYFFRDEAAFAALSKRVLPELIATRRRAGNLRLRVWSAACCTGEEIYSVAMVLHRLLPDLADWQVTLLGTDVNPRFLRKAIEGVYGEWSFRGTSPEFRRRYFRRRAGSQHVLLPDIQRMVTFAPLNLVDDATQASMRHGVFDLILCRNVLMYFTPRQAEKVIATLHGALHQDGWLAVAPCETSQTQFARFQAAHFDGAIFYRKRRPRALDPPLRVAPASPVRPAERVRARPANLHATLPCPPTLATRPARAKDAVPLAQTLAAQARALADQRRMDEALAYCDRWICTEKLDPEAYYLRGMILAETGDIPAACAAFEHSLYLAPDGVMAALALANLERERGRNGQAARHYRNILAALEQQPAEGGIDYGEGLTARQLTALVRDLMAAGEQA